MLSIKSVDRNKLSSPSQSKNGRPNRSGPDNKNVILKRFLTWCFILTTHRDNFELTS